MKNQLKSFTLLTCALFAFVGCGAENKKEEGAPEQKQTVPMMDLKKPEVAVQPENKGNEGTLTPQQEEELKINEDNVDNPIPG